MKLTEFKFLYPEKPKLIHIDQPLFESLSNRKEYVAERKYNGSRLQLHYLDGEFQFWNRHGERMSYKPNGEISEILSSLPLNGYCLFDGELRNNKVKGVRQKIIFYDIFIWQDNLLIGQPFWFRRNLLKKLFKCNAEPIGITEQFPGDFRDVYNVIQDAEIEGLVLKNTRGVLNLGRNSAMDSNWMVKVRKPNGSYQF